jgi:hypothetical protein
MTLILWPETRWQSLHHVSCFCHAHVLQIAFRSRKLWSLPTFALSITRVPSATVYPTELDYPNFHQFPELMMWYFPFIPGSDTIKFPAFTRFS